MGRGTKVPTRFFITETEPIWNIIHTRAMTYFDGINVSHLSFVIVGPFTFVT